MLVSIAIRANNNKVICNIDIINKELFKFKNIKKILGNQKFRANFSNLDISSVFFNLNFNIIVCPLLKSFKI